MTVIQYDVVGQESEGITIRVEAEEVRRFADAIGMPYSREVPPTFVITFTGGVIPGLELPEKGLIHAGQKFTYYRPVKIGDVLTYKRRVKDIFERKGKLDKMVFVVLETEGRNSTGELVFATTATVIVREGE